MNYRAIIRDAWQLTQENKSLIWWFAFIPALITTLMSMGYLVYQAALFWNSRGGAGDGIYAQIAQRGMQFVENHPGFTVLIVVFAALLGLAYLMLPVFSQGALIQIITRMRNGHPLSIMEGIGFGFRRFLQLFEYHLLVSTFSLVSTITAGVSFYRYLGPDAFAVFSWIFILVMVVGLVLTLLFTYSEYYICIEDKNIFKSMMGSSGLVIRHWHHTLFMLILMAIISIRIVINILFAMLIPVLVLGSVLLFANLTVAKLGLIIGLIIGGIALYFTSYFVGIFHVFSVAVWTFTFLELRKKNDRLFEELRPDEE